MSPRRETSWHGIAWLAAMLCVPITACCAVAPTDTSTNLPPIPPPPTEDAPGPGQTNESPQNEPAAEEQTKSADSDQTDLLYQSIVTRNAFKLRPPPEPTPPPEPAPQVTPSALKLTGITTMFSGKQAMFVLQEPNKPQLMSDLVREGEKDSVITNLEVLSIDERAAIVRVLYGGKELSLNFIDNGLKPPAPAPAAVAAGQRVPPRQGITPPQTVAAGSQPAATADRFSRLSRPTMQSPSSSTATGAQYQENPSALRSIPVRPTRLPFSSAVNVVPGQNTLGQQNPQTVLSPEQQVNMMRAQEELMRSQGIPMPPSPPMPGEGIPTDGAPNPALPPSPGAQ